MPVIISFLSLINVETLAIVYGENKPYNTNIN